jgi:dTMP kinase
MALLVAFEGLDQSGKQTQAEMLCAHVTALGRTCQLLSFPDYTTPIGGEIAGGLHGTRDYPADVMQLLYVANRYEKRGQIQAWLASNAVVVCDRYLASSVAYGEAQGLDPEWLASVQQYLPAPDITVLLDILPETAAKRKAAGRDRYERDLALLSRVRESYRRQAAGPGWVLLNGERDKDAVSGDVIKLVSTRLALR